MTEGLVFAIRFLVRQIHTAARNEIEMGEYLFLPQFCDHRIVNIPRLPHTMNVPSSTAAAIIVSQSSDWGPVTNFK